MKKLWMILFIALFFAACPETVPNPEPEAGGTEKSAENERFLISAVDVTPISGTNETEFTWKAEIQTSFDSELVILLDGVSEIGKKTLSGIDEPHSISGTIETPLSLGSHSVVFVLTANGRPSLRRTAYFEVQRVDFTVDAKYFGETIRLGALTLNRSADHFYTFDDGTGVSPENGSAQGGVLVFDSVASERKGSVDLDAPGDWCAVVVRVRLDSGTGTPNLYFGSSGTDYYTYFRKNGVSVYDSSWTTPKASGSAWIGGMEEGVFSEFLIFKDGSSILMKMGEESRILKNGNFSALPSSSVRFGFESDDGAVTVSVDEIGFYTLASSDQTISAPQSVEIEGYSYTLVKAFDFNDSEGFTTSGTITVSDGKAAVTHTGTNASLAFNNVDAFDYVEVRLKYDGRPNLFFDGITAQHFTFFRPQPVAAGYNVWTAPEYWDGVQPTTTYWNYERTKNAYGVYGFAFTDSTVRYLFDRFWAADNGTANAPSSTLSPVLMIQKENVDGGVTVDIDYVAFYKK